MRFSARGFDGTQFTGSRAIVMRATENWTATANGADLSFETTPNGTSTRVEGLRVTQAGNVGIGTTTPTGKLSLVTDGTGLTQTSTDATTRFSILTISGSQVNIGTTTNQRLNLVAANGAGLASLLPNGNFGVGTEAPAARLDVRGDIKLGAAGQFFAPSADENLRIVRGGVNANGTIKKGITNYTTARNATGNYTVTYSTAFTTIPSVVVTPEDGAQRFAYTQNVVAGSFNVQIVNEDGTARDASLDFIAMGSR